MKRCIIPGLLFAALAAALSAQGAPTDQAAGGYQPRVLWRMPLALRFAQHVRGNKIGRWPDWSLVTRALDGCGPAVVPVLVEAFGRVTEGGKLTDRAAAMVDIMLRAGEATRKEKVLPMLKANLDAALKDPNKARLALAIWAYYKAAGKREPLDWKPGNFAP